MVNGKVLLIVHMHNEPYFESSHSQLFPHHLHLHSPLGQPAGICSKSKLYSHSCTHPGQPSNVSILQVMDGEVITGMRTAAVSAISAKVAYLSIFHKSIHNFPALALLLWLWCPGVFCHAAADASWSRGAGHLGKWQTGPESLQCLHRDVFI